MTAANGRRVACSRLTLPFFTPRQRSSTRPCFPIVTAIPHPSRSLTMRTSMLLSLARSAALGVSALAFAGPGDGGFGPGPRDHHAEGMMAMRGLNLTDAQKAQVKQIVQQSFA